MKESYHYGKKTLLKGGILFVIITYTIALTLDQKFKSFEM